MAFGGTRRHGGGRAESDASTRSGQGGLVLLVGHMFGVGVMLGDVELEGNGVVVWVYLDRERDAGDLLFLNGWVGRLGRCR